VAEFGSHILAKRAGIATDDTEKNTIAYLKSRLSFLKDNKRELIQAGQQADKAVNFLFANA
jgi:antirestriction protein ArdC